MDQIVNGGTIRPNDGKVYTTIDFVTAQNPVFALPERCGDGTVQYIMEGSLSDMTDADTESNWSLANRLSVDFAYESVRSCPVSVTGVWVVVIVDMPRSVRAMSD